FQLHTVEQQLQRLRRQTDFRLGITGTLRPAKRALLQSLGQHTDARTIKIEQLDPIMPPVAENEERAAFRVFPQPLPAVRALVSVYRLLRQATWTRAGRFALSFP